MVRRIVLPILSGASALGLVATLLGVFGGATAAEPASLTAVELWSLGVPLSFFALLLWEGASPALDSAPSATWSGVGLFGFVMLTTVGTVTPLVVPPSWLAQLSLVDLSSLGAAAGFALGWLVYTLVGYGWHRLCHGSSFFWRVFHQLHHAPNRLDVASSTVFHPAEALVYTGLTLIVTCALGLTPVAGALLGWAASFVSFFQHASVRTPRFLGYFVQRPEAHSLHHHIGGPRGNYSDLPLWDLVFGTFENPRAFNFEVGFAEPARGRILDMLAFRDVSTSAAVTAGAPAPFLEPRPVVPSS